MHRLKQEIINIAIPKNKNIKKFTLKNKLSDEVVKEINIESFEENIAVDLTTLQPHYKYEYQFIEYDDQRKEITSNSSTLFPIFVKTTDDLEYSYYETRNTSKLLVTFSSSVYSDRFNYTKSLKDIDQSKLFISDQNNLRKDTTASYYLGSMGVFDYEEKIFSLIEDIRIKNGLRKKDVILIGSSKGGFAALYYTFKYDYGYCIAGSPTIYLGKMHKVNTKGKLIITHLTGGFSEKSINVLNNVVTNAVKDSDNNPEIYYHVGKGEPRYSKHALPFIDFLSTNEINLKSLDLGDYSNHSFVANFFPNYLNESLKSIID